MARHLPRLTDGLMGALNAGELSRSALALLQPKSPVISMTAAMQASPCIAETQYLRRCSFHLLIQSAILVNFII